MKTRIETNRPAVRFMDKSATLCEETAALFIDYTFITQPVTLKSIGKCITSYKLWRLFSNWGPRNASSPQHFFLYYKLGGAKTGLDDGEEFGSR